MDFNNLVGIKTSKKQENYIDSNLDWDEYFMRMVYLIASKSKDPRTKIGAVLVKDNRVISTGYNGFPINIEDLKDRYINRQIKMNFVVHAEHNAILTCARFGVSSFESILYTQGIPCNSCMKAIIQGGVKQIIIHSQWPNLSNPEWIESIKISKLMIKESNIQLTNFSKILNIDGFLDGKIIKV